MYIYLAFPRGSQETSPEGLIEHRDDNATTTHGMVASDSVDFESLNLGGHAVFGDVARHLLVKVLSTSCGQTSRQKASHIVFLRRISERLAPSDGQASFSVHTGHVLGHVQIEKLAGYGPSIGGCLLRAYGLGLKGPI